jgi:hypothetical protein
MLDRILCVMDWDWSTQVEIHFVSRLSLDDTSYVLAGMGGIWSTNVEMHFMFSLVWVRIIEHRLICFLYSRWVW